VNCAAIPDQLLESELFGHEKGSFTGAERRRIGRFEQCSGGTILLDEVGDMSSVIQGKVLRLLQEQKFERVGGNELISTDVRIIAATNRPLEQLAVENEFRDDLLYRLNGFTIALPPLRDRRDDIPALLEYFLRRAKTDMNRPELTGIAPSALDLLVDYDWPGNVRQLQSVVRQALLNTTGTVIGSENLPGFIRNPNVEHDQFRNTPRAASQASTTQTKVDDERQTAEANLDNSAKQGHHLQASEPTATDWLGVPKSEFQSPDAQQTAAAPEFSIDVFVQARLEAGSQDLYNELIEQVERRLFTQVLEATGGNQSKTAEILGITRGKVRDRIATFDIQLDRTVTLGK
ncbi:MAG: sigma 54-interacting transcriptional regulator, partial [Aureliella sp.]